MPPAFEILDAQPTRLGELILRRRWIAAIATEVYEVKLGDAFLMSSLFHTVEVALAEIGLDAAAANPRGPAAPPLDVVVGGLGLGYTARAALQHPATGSVLVIDALEAVIDWHRRGLVPLGPALTEDPRCRFVHGDFFAQATRGALDPAAPGRQFDVVLLDIDHSPRNLLSDTHRAFYEADGLRPLAAQIRAGGIFAMWSDDPPDQAFLDRLTQVFADARAQAVEFANPLLDQASSSTVYVARLS